MITVGVDAGGTSSRLEAAEFGRIVAETVSGPANWASTPRSVLQENLQELFSAMPNADAVFVGMAGVLTPQDREDAACLVRELGRFGQVRVGADYESAWRACDHESAILVISGTGSNCSCRIEAEFVRSGVGGSLIADRGCGYGLGRALLNAGLNEGEVRLLGAAMDFAETGTSEELVASLYQASSPVARIAELGSHLLQTLADDPMVDRLLRIEMEALAQSAAMLSRLIPGAKFFRTGGFWNASPRVVGYFEQALGATTDSPPMSPLDGALVLAQELFNS